MGHISNDLRRDVWDEIHKFILAKTYQEGYFNEKIYLCNDFEYIFVCVFAKICQLPKTETEIDYYQLRDLLLSKIMEGKFNEVLDCLEIILNELFNTIDKNDKNLKDEIAILAKQIIILFDKYAAAYQLDISQNLYWFFPRASKEQAEAIQQAIEATRHGGMNGAATHLRKAGQRINEREYADSIRESIHAVESVARKIDPNNGDSLKEALKSLENTGLLKHRALKEAFMKLYGYTSDEEGIRHSLVDQGSADVGLDEAIFMFGACASFTAYLTQKHQHLTPKCPPRVSGSATEAR